MKVAIVGDSQIGKTTLMIYIEDKFDEEFIETLGLNVMEKSFKLKNGIANLQIYDLGGQRQFAINANGIGRYKSCYFCI